MSTIEERIGYKFKNDVLLQTALTHSSYANEKRGRKIENNERLEFLGDSVLGLLCADYLFNTYKDFPEGELTKLRSSIVCERSLFELAVEFGLDEVIILGHGEEAGGGRRRSSILADCFEAVLGAVYLDGGSKAAAKFVKKFISQRAELAMNGRSFKDYKTALQEIVQKNHEEVLRYRLKAETGPDHNKSFLVELLLNSNVIAEGEGRSKKDAEQQAAKAALELMGQT